MSNNCCDTSYYRTPYNVQYQNLYCNLAQAADTNLQNVVTSGWSYNKDVKENYCGCGNSRVYNDSPMAEYFHTRENYDNKGARRMLKMRAAGDLDQGCPTDFYRTPYNVAYQQLYSDLAQRADTNTFTFRENYNGTAPPPPRNVKKVTYFYNR